MKKKFAFCFLCLIVCIFTISIFFNKENSNKKSNIARKTTALSSENMVDKELIKYLADAGGKASYFRGNEPATYVETSSNKKKAIDVSVSVNAKDGAFPKDTEIKVKNVSVDKKEVEKVITDYSSDMEMNGIYAVDISFYTNGKEQQPKEDVLLSIELPENLDYSDSNSLVLLHFGNDGIEVVGTTKIDNTLNKQYLSFKVDSFSTYAVALVNDKYPATLMKELLVDDETYDIVTFKTTLFNYDPRPFNQAGTGERIMFRGYGNALETEDGVGGTTGINDSTSTYAKQGIVQNTLDSNGMPVINYSTVSGDAFFDPDTEYAGKTVYEDVDFEFLYNKNTGYYEYKSSVNHAQYNSVTNKIELYADTMAPLNYRVTTVDLSTYLTDGEDLGSASYNETTGILSVTGSDTSGDSVIAPQVKFDVAHDASSTEKFVLKVYLPQLPEKNKLKLYFTTIDDSVSNGDVFNDEKSYTVEYDTTNGGGWYEFVIETKDNPYWLSKSYNLMVVPFEVSGTGSYDFQIAEFGRIQDTAVSYTYGGFYPFSDISKSYPGNGESFDIDNWRTLLESGDKVDIVSSRSVYNAGTRPDREYLHFGLTTEFDFYMPVSRTVTGQADDTSTQSDNLRFEFTGDDDLWVFVDDKLVLDIGGGHGAITGYIDFTNNEVYVSNAVTVTGYNTTTDTASAAPVTTTIDSSILTPGKHTVKIFYMERAGAASNNLIKFNLPQTPVGDVVVSKEAIEDRGRTDIFDSKEYTFTIAEDSTLIDGLQYQVMGTGIDSYETRTLSNGEFKLKSGQYAVFSIAENKSITVTETESKVGSYNNYATLINDVSGKTLTQTTLADTQVSFNVVNKYRENRDDLNYIVVIDPNYKGTDSGIVSLNGTDTSSTVSVKETLEVISGQAVGSTASTSGGSLIFDGWYSDAECTELLSNDPNYIPPKPSKGYNDASYYAYFVPNVGDLSITKSGASNLDANQRFIFRVTGTSDNTKHINMLVTVNGNSTTTLKDLPVGNYTITEDTNWSWRYEINTNDTVSKNVTLVRDTNTSVSFSNSRVVNEWLSYDSYIQNMFEIK